MKIFINNSLHYGDVFLTRGLIDAIRRKYPNTELLLQCRGPMQYIWRDYGVKIFDTIPDYSLITPTPECPKEFEFFQAWFGTFSDILGAYGLTHVNQVHTFNRQVHYHKTNHFLDLPIGPTGLYLNDLHTECKSDTILVENGPPWSGQCNHGIGYYVQRLAADFPQFNFLCSADPKVSLPNVFNGAQFNLLTLSDLSNKCIAFITQASGVNACTYTVHNVNKPRFFFGFNYPYKIWDDTAVVVQTYEQLVAAMRTRLCKR